MDPNIKIKVATQTVPNGSGVGKYEQQLDFGKEYKRVLGFYVIIQSNGGLPAEAVNLSFGNETTTVVDAASLKHFTVSDSVKISDRFLKDDQFDISGYVNASLKIPAATTSDLVVQYLFLLQR